MIGALLIKRYMEKSHVPAVEPMDPSFMAKWTDDVTVTPMGRGSRTLPS